LDLRVIFICSSKDFHLEKYAVHSDFSEILTAAGSPDACWDPPQGPSGLAGQGCSPDRRTLNIRWAF